jgi:hypothetical protein
MTYTVQIHRNDGPDEDYEASDEAEVEKIIRENSGASRIVVIDEFDRIVEER